MSDKELTLAVVGTSTKENERRAPLYPSHLAQLAPRLRRRIYVESGYGRRFGVDDDWLAGQVAGLLPREQLFAAGDIILLPKPTEADFPLFRPGQILWGWPHCVQGEAITQLGIDKKMTFIAWEAMNLWSGSNWNMHVFHKNNELAGYCSVLHALQLTGQTGAYGPRLRAAVLSFGSTGRGAVHALQGQGVAELSVFTGRPYYAVANQVPGVRFRQYKADGGDNGRLVARRSDRIVPLVDVLSEFDIIVNCILQDPENPTMFITGDDVDRLRPGTLIVDVSCDAGMGFDFARPTTFTSPIFTVGPGVVYYAVDHSPSYLWRVATYEISVSLLPYVRTVMGGPAAWRDDVTISRAIEIEDGIVRNPEILRFQNRADVYPHERLTVPDR